MHPLTLCLSALLLALAFDEFFNLLTALLTPRS